MHSTRRTLIGGAAALSLAPMTRLRAQGRTKLTIGVLTDLSGTYRDNTGPLSVAATRMAVAEMASQLDCDVDVIAADHQNKPDVAASIADGAASTWEYDSLLWTTALAAPDVYADPAAPAMSFSSPPPPKTCANWPSSSRQPRRQRPERRRHQPALILPPRHQPTSSTKSAMNGLRGLSGKGQFGGGCAGPNASVGTAR